jgi:hypothetical protein
MQDKKLKVLLSIGAVWAILFLVTLRVKAPMMEGVEIVVLFAGLAWLAYWTLSTIRAVVKKTPEPPAQESEAPNAPTKEEPKF